MDLQSYRTALSDVPAEERPEVEQYLREQLLFQDTPWLALVDNIAAEPPYDADGLNLLAHGAQEGSAEAAYALGLHHHDEARGIANEDAAIAWMTIAANAGLPQAAAMLCRWSLK